MNPKACEDSVKPKSRLLPPRGRGRGKAVDDGSATLSVTVERLKHHLDDPTTWRPLISPQGDGGAVHRPVSFHTDPTLQKQKRTRNSASPTASSSLAPPLHSTILSQSQCEACEGGDNGSNEVTNVVSSVPQEVYSEVVSQE